MPTQKITLEIETREIPEDERADLAQELLRAANAVLAPFLASRDSLAGDVSRWEQK